MQNKEKKEEKFTFYYTVDGYTVKISNLTWQGALIEQSRVYWQYVKEGYRMTENGRLMLRGYDAIPINIVLQTN